MANDLNQYSSGTTDWRSSLRQNNHRTYIVIFLFFLIYTGIGLLIDMYMIVDAYPTLSMGEIFIALITFKIFPIATLIMFAIAAVSLLVSYTLYDKMMMLGTEYREITATTANTPGEKMLWNVVEEMKIAAGLRYMPKVFVIDADYMNAFASGYSEKSAMVAITRGLMEKLNRDELQAVMAHELSHIRHLDIKLTLTASLLANISIIVLDIFFYSLMSSRKGGRSRSGGLALAIMLIRYLLPLISLLLLMYLSRKRELMADAGSVELMRTNQPLASALLKIQNDHIQNLDAYTKIYQQTPHENVRREAYLYDPAEAGIKDFTSVNDLFSTHPSMQERLAALGYKKKGT